MIVGRLFEALIKGGITVVITSNRPPIDLYKNGVNRELCIPVISLSEANCDVFEGAGVKDYRQTLIAGDKVYFSPLNLESRDYMDLIWSNLTEILATSLLSRLKVGK